MLLKVQALGSSLLARALNAGPMLCMVQPRTSAPPIWPQPAAPQPPGQTTAALGLPAALVPAGIWQSRLLAQLAAVTPLTALLLSLEFAAAGPAASKRTPLAAAPGEPAQPAAGQQQCEMAAAAAAGQWPSGIGALQHSLWPQPPA